MWDKVNQALGLTESGQSEVVSTPTLLERTLQNILDKTLLEEGPADKIKRLEDGGQKLSNLEKVLIQKHENIFDWNEVFKPNERYGPYVLWDRQVKELTYDKITDTSLGDRLSRMLQNTAEYTRSNNYPNAFDLLFVIDIIKKYKTTRDAIPEFKSYILGDVYNQIKSKPTFGDLAKIYTEMEKEHLDKQGDGGKPNSWIVIPSEDNDPENYEFNIERLQAYSSCKTGWCVRDIKMAPSRYRDSDFHLYLDKDGDAVVSLRVIDDVVQEVSGTENESLQHVAEEYQDITIKYYEDNNLQMVEMNQPNFREQELHELLEDYHNYAEILKYVVGDEFLDFYDTYVPDDYMEDFLYYVKVDEDKVVKYLVGEDLLDVDEDGDYDSTEFEYALNQYIENEYGDSVRNIASRVEEQSAMDQMYEAVKDKAQELLDSPYVEQVDPEDKQSILWRRIKPVEQSSEDGMRAFFENGQPQIQEAEGEDPLDMFVENEMTEIDQPYHGWGEWDSDIYKSLIDEYIGKSFTEQFG